jgi:hypothetical protein
MVLRTDPTVPLNVNSGTSANPYGIGQGILSGLGIGIQGGAVTASS